MQFWWKSEDSAKYRQPLDLTHQPSEQPPPARFDTKAIYKRAKEENPPPAPSPTAERPLYVVEDREAWNAMAESARMGDLSPIYEAYRRRDLQFLWDCVIYCEVKGIAVGKEQAAEIKKRADLEDDLISQYGTAFDITLGRRVIDYAGRLLGQIQGHAKFLGNKIRLALTAGDIKEQSSVYFYYFDKLAILGSDESIHEIGRFVDVPIPEGEDEAEKAQRLKTTARAAMWEAVFRTPFLQDPRHSEWNIGCTYTPEEEKRLDEWWRSTASAKYRQPLDLTRPPPEEPPPARFETFETKALKQVKGKKPQDAE